MFIPSGRNTAYVADGIWGGAATPAWLAASDGSRKFLLGYQDNGSGLYAAAYGFETNSTDGLGNTSEKPAIILKNTNGGAYVFQVSNLGKGTFAKWLYADTGDKATPSYSFTGDTNTGMWSAGADTLNFACGGTHYLQISATGITGLTNILLNNASNIELPVSLASSGSGTIIKIGSGTLTAGVCYMMHTDKSWAATEVEDEEFSKGLIAIALGSGASAATDDGMLLNGTFFDSSHGFTPGLPLYLVGDAGALSTTAPSSSGDLVRVVGYAIDTDEIYFCPDNTWVILD
jgi:hypothetical protein